MSGPTNDHTSDRAGTQRGAGDAAAPRRDGDADRPLGAGNEAAEGVHATQSGGDAEPSAQANAATGRGEDASGADRTGSEPLTRKREHVPSYGGMGGEPRTSSDTREPKDPEGDG